MESFNYIMTGFSFSIMGRTEEELAKRIRLYIMEKPRTEEERKRGFTELGLSAIEIQLVETRMQSWCKIFFPEKFLPQSSCTQEQELSSSIIPNQSYYGYPQSSSLQAQRLSSTILPNQSYYGYPQSSSIQEEQLSSSITPNQSYFGYPQKRKSQSDEEKQERKSKKVKRKPKKIK